MRDDDVCGAATTLPADGVIVPSLAGVIVRCDEAPHRDGVHSGPVIVDGDSRGIHYWGADWSPELRLPA